jgi:hypothetical protein
MQKRICLVEQITSEPSHHLHHTPLAQRNNRRWIDSCMPILVRADRLHLEDDPARQCTAGDLLFSDTLALVKGYLIQTEERVASIY